MRTAAKSKNDVKTGDQFCDDCYLLCKKKVFAKVKVFIGFDESLALEI